MEMTMIWIMAISATLFAVGGTWKRWVRWAVLPVILGIIIFATTNLIWWKILAFIFSLGVSLTLPYGEKTPYPFKLMTFIAIAISTIWLGFTWWQAILPVIALIMFWLSNWKYTANIMFWKAWEFLTGAYLGITVADLVSHLGR